jgi:hypothetical protein
MNAGISPGAEISTSARILLSAGFSLAARILPSPVFHWQQGFYHPLDFILSYIVYRKMS